MYSLFLLYRWFTFAFFVVASAIICSVAAWNLSFAQEFGRGSVVQIDSFLVFLGAAGLVAVFPILFVDVLRKGAISSRVWFEVVWTTLFWIMSFAGAVAFSVDGPSSFCNITAPGVVNLACTSSKVLVVFLWLHTGFTFMYFFVLTIFAIVHQKEDTRIWHSGVRDFPWFNTKLCLGSAPSSPVQSSHRLAKPKLPSLAVPKPRRPPPIFVAQRAGLGSNIEIEHFPDPGSLEEAPLPALPPVSQLPTSVSLYPQHVKASARQTPFYQLPNNTYYPSRIGPGSSPPPIRDWPRPLAATNTHASSSTSLSRPPQPQIQVSDRAVGKQRAPAVDRSGSSGSTHSLSQDRGEYSVRPLPQTRETPQRAAPVNTVAPSSYSPSRARPTGPRTRSSSIESATSIKVRPRPPPLDLSRNGSTPSVGRRR